MTSLIIMWPTRRYFLLLICSCSLSKCHFRGTETFNFLLFYTSKKYNETIKNLPLCVSHWQWAFKSTSCIMYYYYYKVATMVQWFKYTMGQWFESRKDHWRWQEGYAPILHYQKVRGPAHKKSWFFTGYRDYKQDPSLIIIILLLLCLIHYALMHVMCLTVS